MMVGLADVPRETLDKLHKFAELLALENASQNLIARGSEPQIWDRHILDSCQLVSLAPPSGAWLDIGSGGGLPGMVVAILRPERTVLAEPRRLRADFLRRCMQVLHLENVEIACAKVQNLTGRFAVVSARAVASIDRLFAMASHVADERTVWVLPKGRSGRLELEEARRSWQGSFGFEASVTDPDAAIVVATGVKRRAKGRG